LRSQVEGSEISIADGRDQWKRLIHSWLREESGEQAA
jgi:hypothetical protein